MMIRIMMIIIPHYSKLKVIPVRTLIKNSHIKFPEDDHDGSKHVVVMTNCV